jgi:putative SOS response-associated peptidase YedK
MCGRYTLKTERESLLRALELPVDAAPSALAPRYNIAPTQLVPVLLDDGGVRMALHRWGLVPEWAPDPSIGNRLINARGETLADKRTFRDAFRERRCLVIADGFYEWHEVEKGKPKVPYYIRMRNEEPFTFAGLWSRWRRRSGGELLTCTIVTQDANELIGRIHHRMPAIIPPERRAEWLDPGNCDPDALRALLAPYDPGRMEMYEVTRYVNSPDHDGELCIRPAEKWDLFSLRDESAPGEGERG